MLRSRYNFGGSGYGSDPSKILRLRLLAPAPGHFQKLINRKFKVMIFFYQKWKKWMIVLRGQNKNKETWNSNHILKNLLVMEVVLLDNYRSRSRSRKRFFFGSGSATLCLRQLFLLVLKDTLHERMSLCKRIAFPYTRYLPRKNVYICIRIASPYIKRYLPRKNVYVLGLLHLISKYTFHEKMSLWLVSGLLLLILRYLPCTKECLCIWIASLYMDTYLARKNVFIILCIRIASPHI